MSVHTKTYLTITYCVLVVQWVRNSSALEPCASHLRFDEHFPAELKSSEYDVRTSNLTLSYELWLLNVDCVKAHATTLQALGFRKVQPE